MRDYARIALAITIAAVSAGIVLWSRQSRGPAPRGRLAEHAPTSTSAMRPGHDGGVHHAGQVQPPRHS